MNKLNLNIATILLASIGMFSTHADAQPSRTVDCDRGDSIQAALDRKVGHSDPITINVTGTCEENVTIHRDGVTISGNNATVIGTIYLEGSDRIIFLGITITGPGQGIRASGSNVTISNVNVTENQDVGIQVYGSKVSLHNTFVTNNQGWTAIQAGHGSTFNTHESNISNNSEPGLYIDFNSMLEMSNYTVVNDNSGPGVQLTVNSSAFIWNNSSIQGNKHGVLAENHAFVDVRNADISNNDTHGILLVRDSGARIQTGSTISGNAVAGIQCIDTESSYENQGGLISDSINCTGFDHMH